MVDKSLLQLIVTYVLTGGGAGAVAYWFWAFLERRFPGLADLDAEYKRYITMALTLTIAVLGFVVGVVMLYITAPVDWRAWIETLVSVIGTAFGVAQFLHGILDLRKKRLNGD